ncbi:MAG: sugar ABC transporter substrate-binding protein [Anaerolineae bacterium]|nr:sugar ABC transporter substrate-binding protein [Anaerolineae bacterium]
MNAKSKICRRELLRVGGAAAAASVLAACAPTPAPTSAPPEVLKETVVVKETVLAQPTAAYEQGELRVLLCCSHPEQMEWWDPFDRRFEEAHPGARVNKELMPAGQNYFERLQTVIAAGTAPDIYDMWEGYVQPYAKNGALLQLDPFYEKDGRLKKEDMWPAALPPATWNGGLYAQMILLMAGPVGLWYNRKLFDQAGVQYPTNDWDWNALREAALKLTRDTNGDGEPEEYGVTFETWFVPWLYWIWSNGGDVFNADETACTLDDPKAYEPIQFWADLMIRDKVAPTSSTLQAMQGSANMFKTGQVAMYVGNCWDLWGMKEARAQGLDWGCRMSPKANNGNRCYYEHTGCYGIWTGSKLPNLAWEYCRDYVLDDECTAGRMTTEKVVPAVKKMLQHFATPETEELGWMGVIESLGDPKKLRYPGAGDKWDKISGLIQAELDLAFVGDKTAEQACKDAVPKVDEELART